jgi:hypothetical protein
MELSALGEINVTQSLSGGKVPEKMLFLISNF